MLNAQKSRGEAVKDAFRAFRQMERRHTVSPFTWAELEIVRASLAMGKSQTAGGHFVSPSLQSKLL